MSVKGPKSGHIRMLGRWSLDSVWLRSNQGLNFAQYGYYNSYAEKVRSKIWQININTSRYSREQESKFMIIFIFILH